jgi:hypothetical protein
MCYRFSVGAKVLGITYFPLTVADLIADIGSAANNDIVDF